jgi:hypothetical protein
MASTSVRKVSIGRIERTELEIESARDDQKRRQAEMDAVRRPIALIDSLFAELEVLNLAGCPRVPESFQPSLQWLFDNCSVECSEPGIGVSPVQLMDTLFDLQESLLAIKGGSLRHRLQFEDERRGWCEVGD